MGFFQKAWDEVTGKAQRERTEEGIRESQQRAASQRQADLALIAEIEKEKEGKVSDILTKGSKEIAKYKEAIALLVIVVVILLWLF